MKKLFSFRGFALSGLLAIATSFNVSAQNGPAKQWDKTFGGSGPDFLQCMQQTSDGGFIIGGKSESGIGGDKSQTNYGPINTCDFWVIKLDINGNKQWDKTFGGIANDVISSLQQTLDGGYILGGHSEGGISGDKSQSSKGGKDFWVVKLDANGNKQWDKTIGGSGDDCLEALHQTSDGGYILGGDSNSDISGDKSEMSRGLNQLPDYWVVKIDASGNKIWDKTFGGTNDEKFYSLGQTSDGGYILGGVSYSNNNGDKSQGSIGFGDYWILKLDSSGNKLWDKTFGGPDQNILKSLQQTSDGGYILAGLSNSNIGGSKTEASKGDFDYWIIKTDGLGNKLWDKTLGGNNGDFLVSIKQAPDGSFLLGGTSNSYISGDKSQNPSGFSDFWVLKVNSNGNKIWDKTIGGNDSDELHSVYFTIDVGLILGGESSSNIGGDKTQASRGGYDFWIVKLAPDVLGTDEATMAKFQLFQNRPNPFSQNTTISFNLAQPEEVELAIYNSLGQTVVKHRKKYAAGHQQIQWRELVPNQQLKAGTYFYQLSAGSFQDSKRMILLNE
jgi:hypothetical protein